MDLSLLLTARCNAACRHCSTDCGPRRTEHLDQEQVTGLMDQAALLSRGEPLQFFLSGGEPFLDLDFLLRILRHGSRLGAFMTCVTNGYWATSETRANSVLTSVKDAGLAELAVSSSPFHEEFVRRQRVERVLGAARRVGLPCTVKFVRTRSEARTPEEITRWATTAGAKDVQELPLLPHLRRGEQLTQSEYPRGRGLPAGPCPGRVLTVREDGRAFTCCTPGGFNDFLSLGDAHATPLSELRDRFYLGGTQQILREHGPIYFARAIIARGLGGRLRSSYMGTCDLCTHVSSDPHLAAVAEEASTAFEVRQLRQVLEAAG